MRILGVFAILAFTAGCQRSMGASDRAPDAAGAAANATPVNASDVTRYPYEKKLKDVSATLLKDGVVHKSPPDGPTITTLTKGTAVTQIAETSDSYLVTFDDPNGGDRKMGWIHENAFTDAPMPVAGGGGGGHGGGHGGGGGGGGGGSRGGGGGGTPPPAPPPGTIFTQPVNGLCPVGFAKSSAGCYKTCNADADCPSGVKCRSGVVSSAKVCTTG